MKTPRRYGQQKDNPAIQGTLTAEEIVAADWKRNYANSGISLDDLRLIVKHHVDEGGDVFRLRNTLVLVTPEDGYTEVKFHTLTADTYETYMTLMVMFLTALNKDQGTQEAYTYLPDKTIFRAAKRLFKEFIDLEDVRDEEDADANYRITIDVAGFVANATQLAAQRGG